jgi:hypothetical protein
MNIKKLTTLLSGLVVLFGTTTAFAIWDTLEASIDTNTIQIGTGTGITATANIAVSDWIPNKQLVPTGVVLKSGDVESAVNVFTVAFSGTLSEDLKLDVIYADVLIGGDATYNSLVTIIVKWSYDASDFTSGQVNVDYGTYGDNLLTHAGNNLPNFYDSTGPTTRANIYIQVTVTLAQPANSTAYNAVVNEDITFDLDFLAA